MSRHQNFTFSEFLELMVLLFWGGRLLTMIFALQVWRRGANLRNERKKRGRGKKKDATPLIPEEQRKRKGKDERIWGQFFFQQMGIAKVSLRVSLFGGPKKAAQFISRRSRPTLADATCHAPSRKYYSTVTTYHNTPNQFHLPMQTCQGSFHCSWNASIAEPWFFHRNMPWLGKDFATPTRGWVNLGRAENGWKGHWKWILGKVANPTTNHPQ